MSDEPARTFTISLPGPLLQTGFWLYVWRIDVGDGRELLYVGRTGDSSSANASPPYKRFGQHLGFQLANTLRKHLEARGIEPESCANFVFIAHGPLSKRQSDMVSHKPVRDETAALEKALADGLAAAGYCVINQVHSKAVLDKAVWASVREAFGAEFPRLLD